MVFGQEKKIRNRLASVHFVLPHVICQCWRPPTKNKISSTFTTDLLFGRSCITRLDDKILCKSRGVIGWLNPSMGDRGPSMVHASGAKYYFYEYEEIAVAGWSCMGNRCNMHMRSYFTLQYPYKHGETCGWDFWMVRLISGLMAQVSYLYPLA